METSELWDRMEEAAKDAPERGLQKLLIGMVGQLGEWAGEKGTTLDAVVEEAGLWPEWVADALEDPTNARLGHLVRIANVLGCTLRITLEPLEPGAEGGGK